MPLTSLVVPVYNEADNIVLFLRDVKREVREPHEILIVYDFPEDSTLPAVAASRSAGPRLSRAIGPRPPRGR